MQLKVAKVLARRRVRRPAEEGREGPDVPDVVRLGVFIETARRHVDDRLTPSFPLFGRVAQKPANSLAALRMGQVAAKRSLAVGK
jgi:hypothetical protein